MGYVGSKIFKKHGAKPIRAKTLIGVKAVKGTTELSDWVLFSRKTFMKHCSGNSHGRSNARAATV